MPKILVCRVLTKELDHLLPGSSPDYFEPMCHALRGADFLKYVDSLIHDHTFLICGDCGGLSKVAKRRGIKILPSEDCIQLLLENVAKESRTLYLTDGWLENLDRIFGLDRLPEDTRGAVLRTILSSISNVVYISSEASGDRRNDAMKLADLLGCRFRPVRGTLRRMSAALEGCTK